MFEKATTSTKKFVAKHKTAITIGATATVCYLIHKAAVDSWNEFLTENDLFDTYYHIGEEI